MTSKNMGACETGSPAPSPTIYLLFQAISIRSREHTLITKASFLAMFLNLNKAAQHPGSFLQCVWEFQREEGSPERTRANASPWSPQTAPLAFLPLQGACAVMEAAITLWGYLDQNRFVPIGILWDVIHWIATDFASCHGAWRAWGWDGQILQLCGLKDMLLPLSCSKARLQSRWGSVPIRFGSIMSSRWCLSQVTFSFIN